MSRFEKEISGQLGEFWKKSATAEIEKIRKQYEDGDYTVDASGVIYNCIGNIPSEDLREKIRYAGIEFDEKATAKAYDGKLKKDLDSYFEKMKNHVYTEEEMYEMRSAFGTGIAVVDVITGQKVYL